MSFDICRILLSYGAGAKSGESVNFEGSLVPSFPVVACRSYCYILPEVLSWGKLPPFPNFQSMLTGKADCKCRCARLGYSFILHGERG
jgi:hypothetical protein